MTATMNLTPDRELSLTPKSARRADIGVKVPHRLLRIGYLALCDVSCDVQTGFVRTHCHLPSNDLKPAPPALDAEGHAVRRDILPDRSLCLDHGARASFGDGSNIL